MPIKRALAHRCFSFPRTRKLEIPAWDMQSCATITPHTEMQSACSSHIFIKLPIAFSGTNSTFPFAKTCWQPGNFHPTPQY